MERTKEETQFLALVKKERERQNISMERLCEGVCSPDSARALESGKWEPGRLVQEYILDRLGVGAEDYEYYFHYEEYRPWKARQRILHSIVFGRVRQAGRRLAAYRKSCGVDDMPERQFRQGSAGKGDLERQFCQGSAGKGNLERQFCRGSSGKGDLDRQFCLVMRAQIRRSRGGTREELCALYEEAVRLTMPGAYRKPLKSLVLSARELNLLLEAEQYRKEGERQARYREIVEYIQGRKLGGWSRAKIYPKAVYFLCRCVLSGDTGARDPVELEEYISGAVELLRTEARMYCLWELLELYGRIGSSAAETLARQGDREGAGAVSARCLEYSQWKRALEEVYGEYRVPKETEDSCYFYVEGGVSCLRDVICIRREMLGMGRRELTEGICSGKTLRRLEQGSAKTQRAVVEELLERLMLPGETARTDLATSDREARELMRMLRVCVNEGRWGEMDLLKDCIGKKVSMEIRWNQQTILSREVLAAWKRGDLSAVEYRRQMRRILELTLPYEAFLKEGKKYVTRREQICIQNMMQAMDRRGEEYTACMSRFEEMYQFCRDKELEWTVITMYEFAMSNIASTLGNLGQYDKSDWYNEHIIEGCLRFRRLGALHRVLYGRWWNNDKRKNRGIPNDKTTDDVEKIHRCLLLSSLARCKNSEHFYRDKLKMIEKSSAYCIGSP